MAKVLALAVSAPLLLIGAAYPENKPGTAPMAYSDPVAEAPITYRPCRPGPGDDHCIQLYEPGVRAAYARWLRDHRERQPATEVAMGGPVEQPGHPPRRRHEDSPERCIEHDGHGGDDDDAHDGHGGRHGVDHDDYGGARGM